MNLKDTKIYIPEIPKEWTQRTRSGNKNVWNDPFYENGLPKVELEPPVLGLYAERFEDGWYWVCGCHKCLENNKPYSYVVCEEHDRCITCGIPRKELTDIPWGRADGIQCKTCHAREHEERKVNAIQSARESGHSEDNCVYTREVLCPVCGTENSNDDMHESSEHEVSCFVCDTEFNVEVSYETRYTSTMIKG